MLSNGIDAAPDRTLDRLVSIDDTLWLDGGFVNVDDRSGVSNRLVDVLFASAGIVFRPFGEENIEPTRGLDGTLRPDEYSLLKLLRPAGVNRILAFVFLTYLKLTMIETKIVRLTSLILLKYAEIPNRYQKPLLYQHHLML